MELNAIDFFLFRSIQFEFIYSEKYPQRTQQRSVINIKNKIEKLVLRRGLGNENINTPPILTVFFHVLSIFCFVCSDCVEQYPYAAISF